MKSLFCNGCGRFYNSDRYQECPYCGAKEENEPEPSNEQVDMDIFFCKKGHRIEGRNVSYCPYCGSTKIRKEGDQQDDDDPRKVPGKVNKLPIILSAVGVLAVIIVVVLIITLSGGKEEKTAEIQRDTTEDTSSGKAAAENVTEKITEKTTEKKTESVTEKRTEDTKYEKPAVYAIDDGFFVINTDLFEKSYLEITKILRAQGYSDTFERYIWFSDTNDYTGAWINPSKDVSVGFFFYKDKLVAMEYNDKKADFVTYQFETKIQKYVFGDYMKYFALYKGKTQNNDFSKNKLGYRFTTNNNINGIYSIRRHSYVDDKGKTVVTVSQIYNTSEVYFYDSEYEVWQ